MGGDHSCFELTVPQGSVLESKIKMLYLLFSLFKPLLLSLLMCLIGISQVYIHVFLAKVLLNY